MSVDIRQLDGKWADILQGCGIEAKALSGKNGPCPWCGGRDRFRFLNTENRGTFICGQCGAGDGMEFAMRALGLNFKEALDRVLSLAGLASISTFKPRTDEQNRAAMRDLWKASSPICATDPAGRYLINRVGFFPTDTGLRYAERAPKDSGHCRAMLAKVVAPDGQSSTIHRTFLTKEGHKAPGEAPRRLMPGRMAPGSAARLAPAVDALGVAEGTEKALAAAVLWNVPVWATIGTANMEAFIPPATVKHLWIFGDNDANFAGQSAAYRLANRAMIWASQSKRELTVTVEIPPSPGIDWDDMLLAKSARAEAS